MTDVPDLAWTYRAKLHRVVDGDTLDLLIDLGFGVAVRERVRLLGLDAPEVVGTARAEGLAAKRALHVLLGGAGDLRIRTVLDKRDGFRRYLAEVWHWDGYTWTHVNAWLVERGHAVVDVRP